MKRVQICSFLIILSLNYSLFASRGFLTTIKPLSSIRLPEMDSKTVNSTQTKSTSSENVTSKVPSLYYKQPIAEQSVAVKSSINNSNFQFNTQKAFSTINRVTMPLDQSASSSIFGKNLSLLDSSSSQNNGRLQSSVNSFKNQSGSAFLYGKQPFSRQNYSMYRPLFEQSLQIDPIKQNEIVFTKEQKQEPVDYNFLLENTIESDRPQVKRASESIQFNDKQSQILKSDVVQKNRNLNSLELAPEQGFQKSITFIAKEPIMLEPATVIKPEQISLSYEDGSVLNFSKNQTEQVFSYIDTQNNLGIRCVVGENRRLEIGFKDQHGQNSIITIIEPTVLKLQDSALLQALPEYIQKELPRFIETQAVQDVLTISQLPYDQLQVLEQSLVLVNRQSKLAEKNHEQVINSYQNKDFNFNEEVAQQEKLVLESLRSNESLPLTLEEKLEEKIPVRVEQEVKNVAQVGFKNLPSNSSRFSKVLAILQKIQEIIVRYIDSIGAYNEDVYQKQLIEQLKNRYAQDLTNRNVDESTWLAKIKNFMFEAWKILISKLKKETNPQDLDGVV